MKCPNCGAETKGTVCEYCGSEIRQQRNSKAACSKCGSTNIAFKRENQGEVRGKKSKQVIHRTVGYCKDCGNTWYVAENVPKKRKTWLWVLGWICIFPLPLTILLLRKKNMKPVVKYLIIAVAWLAYLLIAFSGNSEDKESSLTEATIAPTSQVEESSQVSTPAEAPLTFIIMDGELGEYGEEVVLNAETEFEEHEITYYIPAGTYSVTNLNAKGGGQVTVYSGGPEYDGEWQYFVADENCASPIVVMAGETKELAIKEGQFIVLSDGTENIQFVLK